jgi:phosphoribosylanthranilate isomerase
MFVKICGITRLEDALAAADCGADAVGFVFWPTSPRYIDPGRARAIVERLPAAVTPVGVFVDQPADWIAEVVAVAGLGAIQLHGDESVSFAGGLPRPVIKAVSRVHEEEIGAWPSSVMLLVDAHDPVRRGGTGETSDWTAAARLARTRPILLAGGLTPANVGRAIAAVRPHGIDVSSGVESAPAVKDHERLRALFEAIHHA